MIAQLDWAYMRTRPTKALKRIASYALFEGRPLTTKGRWFNSLVFSLQNHMLKRPKDVRVDRPVFIVGTGRSGTTILGVVMSMHRSIGFLNEPKAIWHRVCSTEDLIGNYTTEAARYRLGAEDVSADAADNARKLFAGYLALTRSNRLLDKYPELVFRLSYVRSIFPDAKFLFLVRAANDTLVSIDSWSKRDGTQSAEIVEDWWGENDRKWHYLIDQVASGHPELTAISGELRTSADHRERAAVEWLLSMEEGFRWLESNPGPMMLVRYEDLTANPARVLGEVYEFCELKHDAAAIHYANETLKPTPPRARVTLRPELERLVDRTMKMLGYSDNI